MSKYSKDGKVYFEDETHGYTYLPTMQTLQSVTTVKKKFVPQFDPTDQITKKCAEREGIPVAELKKRWAALGEEAKTTGRNIHFALESYLRNKSVPAGYETLIANFQNEYNQAKTLYASLTKDGRYSPELFATESILYDVPTRLAGQVDFYVFTQSREIVLIDFKTDNPDKIQQNWHGAYLYPPFDIPEPDAGWTGLHTRLTEYAIQLNLYRYMFEIKGYKVLTMQVWNINKETFQITAYEVPFLREATEKVINDRKKTFS